VLRAGREDRGERERQQQRGERQEDVGDPHDHVVQPAAGGAGQDAERHADEGAEREHAEDDEQRRPRAVEHAREDVAAELVGAERMAAPGRGQRVHRVRHGPGVGGMWRDERREDRQQEQHDDDAEADGHERLAAQQPAQVAQSRAAGHRRHLEGRGLDDQSCTRGSSHAWTRSTNNVAST
jgi:hypothetical protein